MVLSSAVPAMAMDHTATEIEPPVPAMGAADASTASMAELQTMLDELTRSNDELRADNSTLQATLDELARENDSLRSSLGRFDDLYDPLEADRQLLLDLRKSLPETRPEAEAQIERIQQLALSSDPARLGQLVDRIGETAPTYLDWRFGDFGSATEFSQAYVATGANAFDSTMEAFRSAALMSVASRLDGLLTILDRVR